MRTGLSDPISYSTRRRYLDRDLGLEAGGLTGRVLEVGCGRTGRRGQFRPPSVGISQWTYVDRDIARSPHLCADASRLPLEPGWFDAVVCLEVLEYVWEPARAIAEFKRVLKPGGTLMLSTPFVHRTDAPDDYWRFTEPALRRLLQEAGFEVIRCRPQGHAVAVVVGVWRHVISVQHPWIRRLLSVALRPLFAAFLGADAAAARRRPVPAAFTTGFLVVARSTTGPS